MMNKQCPIKAAIENDSPRQNARKHSERDRCRQKWINTLRIRWAFRWARCWPEVVREVYLHSLPACPSEAVEQVEVLLNGRDERPSFLNARYMIGR